MTRYLLVINLLLPAISRAQINPTRPGPLRPWVLKFAPLSLIDLSSTVQFAAERVVAPNQSLQLEVGYGWQAMNIWLASNRFSQYEVWRGRAEWRQYWRGRQAPYGAYTAIEGLYKRENAFAMTTMEVNTNMGQLQYTLQTSLPLSKDVFGISVKIGRQFPLTTNGRLVCDFYGGLGLRTRSIQRTNPPDGYHLSRQPLIDINPFINLWLIIAVWHIRRVQNRLHTLMRYPAMAKTLSFLLANPMAPLAWSQDSLLVYHQPSRFVVKLAPHSLFDQGATVQADLAYRPGQRTSVQP